MYQHMEPKSLVAGIGLHIYRAFAMHFLTSVKVFAKQTKMSVAEVAKRQQSSFEASRAHSPIIYPSFSAVANTLTNCIRSWSHTDSDRLDSSACSTSKAQGVI